VFIHHFYLLFYNTLFLFLTPCTSLKTCSVDFSIKYSPFNIVSVKDIGSCKIQKADVKPFSYSEFIFSSMAPAIATVGTLYLLAISANPLTTLPELVCESILPSPVSNKSTDRLVK